MKRILLACLLALTVSGCVERVYVQGPPPVAVQAGPPPVVEPTPPPPVAYVPDYYVWDGYEYVGVCGDRYVYWNGGAWLFCDAVMLGRFHGWERYHPAWRRGAMRYRRGHEPHR